MRNFLYNDYKGTTLVGIDEPYYAGSRIGKEEMMTIEIDQQDFNVVMNNEQALQRAIYKWIKFMQAMWGQIKDENEERKKKTYNILGILFRVVIIVLSATITTISDISGVPRTVITIFAGTMTALTGIEAYIRFTERGLAIQQQQREVQALRDDLRYKWMIAVELEPDLDKRLEAAKSLLDSGPKSYNNILNKYTFKSKESENQPEAT
jgi:hypothetical protein